MVHSGDSESCQVEMRLKTWTATDEEFKGRSFFRFLFSSNIFM